MVLPLARAAAVSTGLMVRLVRAGRRLLRVRAKDRVRATARVGFLG